VANAAKHMCMSRLAENIALIEHTWWASTAASKPVWKTNKVNIYSRYTSKALLQTC